MPSFMQNADRIVGGEEAPSMIPWQVSIWKNNMHWCSDNKCEVSQFCDDLANQVSEAAYLKQKYSGNISSN